MAFRLAKMAGRVDVDDMLMELDPEQLDEWLAYHSLEPIDDIHLRETLTLVGTHICRALGIDVTPEDMRIELGPRPRAKPASVACIKANLATFVALHNASVT